MGRRLALLIATYLYQDSGLRQLTTPAHDAEALAEVLADPAIAGFEVTTLVNEPHHRVGQVIGDFYNACGRDDLTLLYFTGHGLKDDDGRLYLAMTNTLRDNLLFTGLSAEQVDQAMESCRSRQKVLVLDCCYSGAFPAGRLAKGDTAVHALERFQGRGRTVLTASDATQYSFEGDQPHGQAAQSVFTRHLVAGLRDGSADLDGDGDITLDELYSYVHERVVAEMPRQRPKKQDNVEGRTIVARNINWTLPVYLRNAVDSPIAADRLAALEGLAHLYRIGNDLVRDHVLGQIRDLTDDDSKLVSATASTLQLSFGPEPSPPSPGSGPGKPTVSAPTHVPTVVAEPDLPALPASSATASSGTPAVPDSEPAEHRPRTRWFTLVGGILALASAPLMGGGGTGGMGSLGDWYLSLFGVVAVVAGSCVLARRTRSLVGPGMLVGVAVAAVWGGVAFGLELPRFPWHHNVLYFTPVGHATLYLAALVVALPLFVEGGVRFQLRRKPGVLTWPQVGLLTAASCGVGVVLVRVHLSNQLFESSFLVAAILAVVVPLVVAVLAPATFALSVMAGWLAGLWAVWSVAGVGVDYPGATKVSVGLDVILALGGAMLILTLVFAAVASRRAWSWIATYSRLWRERGRAWASEEPWRRLRRRIFLVVVLLAATYFLLILYAALLFW